MADGGACYSATVKAKATTRKPARSDVAIAKADAAGHARLALAISQARALLLKLTLVNAELASRDTVAAIHAAILIDAADAAWKLLTYQPLAADVKSGPIDPRLVADLLLRLSFLRAAVQRGEDPAQLAIAVSAKEGPGFHRSSQAWELAIRTFPGVPAGWRWAATPALDGAPIGAGRPRKGAVRPATWDVVVARLLREHTDESRDVTVDAKNLRDVFGRWLKGRQRRDVNPPLETTTKKPR